METKKFTITIPYISVINSLQNSYTNLKQQLHNMQMQMQNSFHDAAQQSHSSFASSFNRFGNMGNNFKKFNVKKLLLAVVPLLIIVVLVTVIAQALRSRPEVQSASTATANTNKDFFKSTGPLNRVFNFPLTNDAGKEIGTFSYEVQNAELRNEILVKGQRATSVAGRTFLIINLKLKNDLKQGLQINTRDYMRLSTNGNRTELLAPNIHNDPVEVQAISTEYTRLAYPINESDKNLVLIIGEIDGDKQEIVLEF